MSEPNKDSPKNNKKAIDKIWESFKEKNVVVTRLSIGGIIAVIIAFYQLVSWYTELRRDIKECSENKDVISKIDSLQTAISTLKSGQEIKVIIGENTEKTVKFVNKSNNKADSTK